MQTTRIIFLRHAHTQKDPSVNAALWGLSDEGEQQAHTVAELPIMQEVEVIYVSEEKKTELTALPLAQKLGMDMRPKANFDEVKRGDAFLSEEAFEREKRLQLTDLDHPAFGGETGRDALTRFSTGVEEVAEIHKHQTILIVTHGTVLNIYFADLLKVFDLLPQRWQQTAFCAYGVVEDGVVTKDIISDQSVH